MGAQNVIAEWAPNDSSEGVTQYNMFLEGVQVGTAPAPPFTFTNVPSGQRTFGVQAQNNDPAPDNVSDIATAQFTVPHGKPSKPGSLVVHL